MKRMKISSIILAAITAITFFSTIKYNVLAASYEEKIQFDNQQNGQGSQKNYKGFIYKVIGNEVVINGYKNDDKVIDIPEEIEGMKVTAIGQDAMDSYLNGISEDTQIDKIMIPKTVTSINYSAFVGCKVSQICVDEENKVYSSVDGVLYNKDKTILEKYPEGKSDKEYRVLDGTKKIAKYAFYIKDYENQPLTNIILPDSVSNIENDAFSNRHAKVNIPESVTNLSTWCVHLETETINLSKNLKTFSREAIGNSNKVKKIEVDEENQYFTSVDGVLYTKDMTELVMYPRGKEGETFKIPEGVKKIRQSALGYCDNLKKIEVPSSVEVIENSAFIECENLQEVKLAEGIKKIEGFAFSHSHKLKSLVIPDSVKDIEKEAFEDCQGLETVVLGSGIEQIGDGLFRENFSLKDVTIKNVNATYGVIAPSAEQFCKVTIGDKTAFEEGRDSNGIIYRLYDDHAEIVGYTKKMTSEYIAPTQIGDKKITKISCKIFAFDDLTSSRIVLPEGIETVDNEAFYYFNKAKSIVIPSSIKKNDAEVFNKMSSLESIELSKQTEIINKNKLNKKINAVVKEDNKDVIAQNETKNDDKNIEVKTSDNGSNNEVSKLDSKKTSNTADMSNTIGIFAGAIASISLVFRNRKKKK